MEKLDSPVYVTFAVMFPSSWENSSLKIFTSKHNKTEKNPNWIYFIFIQMLLKLAPLYISLCCVVWILWLWWKQLFDLREAWTLGDAYYGSLTCIDPSLLLFIVTLLCVPLYTVTSCCCCQCFLIVVLLYLWCISAFWVYWW